MYDTNFKRKPKKKDGFHIMQNIVRAVDERFHIDNEYYGLEVENYNNYFQQCIDMGFIVRVKGTEFVAEYFNVTPKGHSFHKRPKGKFSIEQKFNYGVGSTTIGYKTNV